MHYLSCNLFIYEPSIEKTLIYIHTLCVGTGKVLSALTLFTQVISTKSYVLTLSRFSHNMAHRDITWKRALRRLNMSQVSVLECKSLVRRYIQIRYLSFSYDAASGSEITPCNKIDKPLVVWFTDFRETL